MHASTLCNCRCSCAPAGVAVPDNPTEKSAAAVPSEASSYALDSSVCPRARWLARVRRERLGNTLSYVSSMSCRKVAWQASVTTKTSWSWEPFLATHFQPVSVWVFTCSSKCSVWPLDRVMRPGMMRTTCLLAARALANSSNPSQYVLWVCTTLLWVLMKHAWYGCKPEKRGFTIGTRDLNRLGCHLAIVARTVRIVARKNYRQHAKLAGPKQERLAQLSNL